MFGITNNTNVDFWYVQEKQEVAIQAVSVERFLRQAGVQVGVWWRVQRAWNVTKIQLGNRLIAWGKRLQGQASPYRDLPASWMGY